MEVWELKIYFYPSAEEFKKKNRKKRKKKNVTKFRVYIAYIYSR